MAGERQTEGSATKFIEEITLEDHAEIYFELSSRQSTHTARQITHRGVHPTLGSVTMIQCGADNSAVLISGPVYWGRNKERTLIAV